MRQLKDIAHIRLKADINCDVALDLKREFPNYFRLFKDKTETVKDNSFYSPFFAEGDIIRMSENYGDRKNAMNAIFQGLIHNDSTAKESLTGVYLSYDFRLAAVNETYFTDDEFKYFKKVVEKATADTGLYVAFMVSHFDQLTGKALARKPEHYHILLSRSKAWNQPELGEAVRWFAYNLQSELIVVRNSDER